MSKQTSESKELVVYKPEAPVAQKPSKGRIVMYCDTFKNGAIYPAIIAEVGSELIHLVVFDLEQNPCATKQLNVRYSEGKESGTWHWPERV